jgi:hypothetical protein
MHFTHFFSSEKQIQIKIQIQIHNSQSLVIFVSEKITNNFFYYNGYNGGNINMARVVV